MSKNKKIKINKSRRSEQVLGAMSANKGNKNEQERDWGKNKQVSICTHNKYRKVERRSKMMVENVNWYQSLYQVCKIMRLELEIYVLMK